MPTPASDTEKCTVTVCPRWSYNVDRRADRSCAGELDSVVQQVQQDLAQPGRISDIVRHVRRHFRSELQAFLLGVDCQSGGRFPDTFTQQEGRGLNWPAKPKTRTPRPCGRKFPVLTHEPRTCRPSDRFGELAARSRVSTSHRGIQPSDSGNGSCFVKWSRLIESPYTGAWDRPPYPDTKSTACDRAQQRLHPVRRS